MRALSVVFLFLLAGCPANFIEAWEVAEPRLMGARIELEADASVPRPKLGETFALRQFLALPGPLTSPLASRYSMALALCLGFKTPTGSLACIDDQSLSPELSVVSDTEILLRGIKPDLTSLRTVLGLPDSATTVDINTAPQLKDLDRLPLFGVLCVDGKAERVPGKTVRTDPPSQLFRCTGNQGAPFPDPTVFTLSVYLDRGLPSDVNHNPAFACDPSAPDSACNVGVMRENESPASGSFVLALPKPKDKTALRTVLPWPASDNPEALPQEGCADNKQLLQVHAGEGEYTIRARFDPSDRETYQHEIATNGVQGLREEREALDLTHALTIKGGDLNRDESLLDKAELDANAEISVTYKPPKQSAEPTEHIPENGRLVRFYFTLRDQRGGVDYALRELCLVPGLPAASKLEQSRPTPSKLTSRQRKRSTVL
ncbi:MAG: hypothetical protein JWN48_2323 [Myxococcaceae bacterium]|nr:hypothetical protein [Myxococcaceae bacterium]